MRALRRALRYCLHRPAGARLIVPAALRLHNLSYQVAGAFSTLLEPDRLHPKHRLMQYHRWFQERLQDDWDVLDIGCGNGALAYDLIPFCRSVFAVDILGENIERARQQYQRDGIEYICADATTFPFTRRFDAIVLSNVLEHIEHRVDFLKRIYANQIRQRPPVLLLRVPMIDRDWITLYKKDCGVEYRLDRTHFTEYTLDQITQETGQAGLEMVEHEVRFGEFYGVFHKPAAPE